MAIELVTDEDVKSIILNSDRVVIKFHADWCDICKILAPKFKRLSSDERYQEIKFLDVNSESNPEASKMAEVKSLPTFAIFKEGNLLKSISTEKEEALVELLDKLVDK
jgi:thioredoxin-like negative regulator of GroEL